MLVRDGVFETNSSSCHSFTSNNSETLTSLHSNTEDGNGYYCSMSSDFGWEQDEYFMPDAKLEYLCLLCSFDNSVNYERMELIKAMFKDHTGLDLIVNENPTGYVDHQSHDIIDPLFAPDLFESVNENLKRFVFDPGWILKTDNDNH